MLIIGKVIGNCPNCLRHVARLFNSELNRKFVVFLQVVDPSDVTLVVQLSIDRLQMIETICLHWEGKDWQQVLFATPPPGELFFSWPQTNTVKPLYL